nr:hypothetical protein [Anaerovorax sp. IOR16]
MGCTTSKIRFAEASRLLDYGFATYDSAKLAEKNEVMGSAPVQKGSTEVVNAICPEMVSFLVKKGQKEGITTEVKLNKSITAPVKKGDEIGTLLVYKDKKQIKSYPLLAEEDVERAGFLEMYIRMLKTIQ